MRLKTKALTAKDAKGRKGNLSFALPSRPFASFAVKTNLLVSAPLRLRG